MVREATIPVPEARCPPSAPRHVCRGHACRGLDAVAPTDVLLVASALALAVASGVSGVHVDVTAPLAGG